MPDQTDVEKESERTNDLPSESSENPHDNETVQADRTISRVSTAGSIWITEKMSLPREALLVGVICMAQFCTREQLRFDISRPGTNDIPRGRIHVHAGSTS